MLRLRPDEEIDLAGGDAIVQAMMKRCLMRRLDWTTDSLQLHWRCELSRKVM